MRRSLDTVRSTPSAPASPPPATSDHAPPAPADASPAAFDDKPHDECGVVAISGVEGAAELAFLGLYSLQHRGQEAAGMVAIDSAGTARLHKDLGLVADVFDSAALQRLEGRTALGHVRYSTTGGGGARNAQPILVRYAEGDLAVAHNGNLTNAHDLRSWLVREGSIFQGTNDSEVVVHLVARSRHESVDLQIDDALTHLEGAFSMVISVGDTLYAVRDRRGFRPLVLGRLEGGHVVASETCALDIMGATYVRDIEPGEVLKIR